MIWRMMICVATAAVVIGGCGRTNKPLDEETDLGKFFGRKAYAPSDSSVQLQALRAQADGEGEDGVKLTVLLYNGSETPRTLPLGFETSDGIVYSYLSAVIKAPDGQIRRVALAPESVEGDLYAPRLEGDANTIEVVDLGPYGDFSQSGAYQVVLFYTVKDEPLPGGAAPDWTGTVWSSPIVINNE